MDIETYVNLQKRNEKTLNALMRSHLQKAWFLSYHLTEDPATAAPLLIKAWSETVDEIANAEKIPDATFRSMLHGKLLTLSLTEKESDDDFASFPEPQVAKQYQPFVNELKALPTTLRTVYLFRIYGSMSVKQLSRIFGTTTDEITQMQNRAEAEINAYREQHGKKKGDWKRQVQLFAEFKSPADGGFREIEVPEFLETSILHKSFGSTKRKTKSRKESKPMATNVRKKTNNTLRNRLITAGVIVVVCVVLGVILIPRLTVSTQASSVTTYNIEAVTVGNVDTTISGSGTLTPVSKDTLATTAACTVSAVNYEVGDSVDEGEVIATVTLSSGSTVDYTAPYDCVLLELPIASEDELEASSEIAMVMGTDGFTMGIAVDEQDISTVKVGQEVTFTIDAVDGDYTGSVSAVSYNGSTSGSTTAYQITAKVDYIEGVYPGMSASAEIVVESSGEGMLLPVDAVRTSGDDSYVYLAPSNASEGDEYDEGDLDLSDLTKVTVETGMSDGSYIIVESDELAEGDLVVIVTVTSTQTGSDSTDGTADFGGGGMDFGDFDFENFDPSTMPNGGDFSGFGS